MRFFHFCKIAIVSALICLGSLNVSLAQASVVSGSVITSKTAYSVGAGNNRLIVVAVTGEAGSIGTITGITWGAQALTQARTQESGGTQRTDLWYLNEAGISAARGSCSYNFVVTWSSAPTNEVFAAMTIKDADQTTPVANANSAQSAATQTQNTGNITVGINDIMVYATSSNSDRGHTAPGSYTEQSDQTIGGAGGTSMATAIRAITVGSTENPNATWTAPDSQLINVGVAFNGVTSTFVQTFYSIATGAWDANTSWSFSSDGSGGAVPVGVWPTRTDNVVIRTGHNITINAIDDNKSCGISPDGLLRSNVGPFAASNLTMFYQTGDIQINGTLTVTGIELMTEGNTKIFSGGVFNLTSSYVNLGFLEADAGSTLSAADDLILAGNSNTIINSASISNDDLIISFTNATLCGTGTTTLQNGGGSLITYANGATVSQICTSFTVNCIGGGCSGFPVVGTTSILLGNVGPGGIGNASNNRLWLMANQQVYINAGTTLATDNQLVQQWNDFSGNSRHASELTSKPTLRTNIVNGFPVIRYDNTDRLLSTGLTTANSASVYVVAQYSSLPPNNPGLVQGSPTGLGFSTTGTDKVLGMWVNSAGTPWGRVVQTNNTSINIPQVTSLTASTFFALSNIVSASSLTVSQYVNNVVSGSIAYNGTLRSWTDFGIGRQGNETWNGDIAEVVVYSADLNSAQRAILSNYLSAKYNTPLSVANDLYTMDIPATGNFDFNVAGIGQASDGSNHRDARGSGVVRMWNPNGLANGEFLIWGHNSLNFSGGNTDVDGVIIQERISRVWRLSEVGDVGTVSISVDLSGTLGSALGSNLRLLIDRDGDGFADNDVTPVAGSFSGTVVTFSGINFQNGDRFTIGNTNLANPLPIELISFNAAAQQALVKLQWSTASELNNDFFTIQRSQNAEDWEDVVEVKGAGNSNERIDYETTDGLPYTGVSYYRLKQTDFDKQYSYSRVKRVEVTQAFQLKVYPNPSSGTFRITTGFEILPSDVKFTNMLGQTIPIKLQTDGTSVIVNSDSISPGIYILRVSNGYWKQSMRVVIQ
jgi:Secretion system C-terminal sorting domain